MHIYDTVILGSGYSSVGYALKNKNTVICEENQICDTEFYLPLKSFKYVKYTPKTKYGKQLESIFSSLSLFKDDMQNTNAFECAFCKFIIENNPEILLKCRVLGYEAVDGIFKVSIHTNNGISYLYAKKVINTYNQKGTPYFTVLFSAENEDEAQSVAALFKGSFVEKAFYEKRYALHLPVRGFDENTVKAYIYNQWKQSGTKCKILYMAPVFYYNERHDGLCDCNYSNPIEALEAGYFYKEELK